MSDIALRRKLLEQAQLMVRTNNPEVCMQQFSGLLNTLGDLLGAWTGEKVRVHITAAGQGESVDMQKAPESAATAHH